jgi:multicomponent Na+:H+ antiporter subunit C
MTDLAGLSTTALTGVLTTDFVGLATTRHAYLLFVLLSTIGLYMLIANENLVKKIIGLNMFQTGVFLFFITSAYRVGGSAPIVEEGAGPYVSPLPHVIVLTAIVVGISLTAVGLALTIRLYKEYGTLRADALREVIADE